MHQALLGIFLSVLIFIQDAILIKIVADIFEYLLNPGTHFTCIT